MIKEFREFINRGSVMDLAVAVVMGAAFTAIVNSLVDDIIMPLVGVLLGGVDLTTLSFASAMRPSPTAISSRPSSHS